MAVSVRVVSPLLFPSTEPARKPKSSITEPVANSLLPSLLVSAVDHFGGILPGGSMMQRAKQGGAREPQWVY